MKNFKNLNEQINRMKVLYGFDFDYDKKRLMESELLLEQPKTKLLMKALSAGDEVAANLLKSITKNLDDAAKITKLIDTDFSSFGKLLDNINDPNYNAFWKSLVNNTNDFDYMVEAMDKLKKIESNPDLLAVLREKVKNGEITKDEFLGAMPTENGMIEIMNDLWDDVMEGKSVKNTDEVVVIKKGNDIEFHVVDPNNKIVNKTIEVKDKGTGDVSVNEKTGGDIDSNAQIVVDDYYNTKVEVVGVEEITESGNLVVYVRSGEKNIIMTYNRNGELMSVNKMDENGILSTVDPKEFDELNIKEKEVITDARNKAREREGDVDIPREINVTIKNEKFTIKSDMSQSEIYNMFKERFKKVHDDLKGQPKKLMTIDDVKKFNSEGNGMVAIINPDGTIEIISELAGERIIMGPDFTVKRREPIGDTELTSPVNGGEGPTVPPPDSPGFWERTKKVTKMSTNFLWQSFRYVMPFTSQSVKFLIGWIPGVRKNLYGGSEYFSFFSRPSNRFSVVNMRLKGKPIIQTGSLGDYFLRPVEKGEFMVRSGVELVVLLTINQVVLGLQGKGRTGEETFYQAAFANFPQSWIYRWHPITWTLDATISFIKKLSNIKDLTKTVCRKKHEMDKNGNMMSDDQLKKDPGYQGCIAKVAEFWKEVDDSKIKIEEILKKETYKKYIKNFDDWTKQDVTDFCEDTDLKEGFYKDLEYVSGKRNDLEVKFDSMVKDQFGTKIGFAKQLKWVMKNYIKKLDVSGFMSREIPTIESQIEKLFPAGETNGIKLDSSFYSDLKDAIEQKCSEIAVKKQEQNTNIENPENLTPVDGENVNPSDSTKIDPTNDSLRKDEISFNMEFTPIQIIPNEEDIESKG